jgi:hypothetical protein
MRGGKPSVTLEVPRKLGNEATFHKAIFRKAERPPHRQLVRIQARFLFASLPMFTLLLTR